jgi:5'-methylthioadenosine phosphorylase
LEEETMENTPILAIIGGSGLYGVAGLEDKREYNIDTPFGKTSAPIVVGKMEGQPVAFLARHGIGHFISPTEVNYRANIYALKSLGVDRIVSISACGSLRDDYAPGDIVVPDGLLDFTRKRKSSFFEQGLVVHISVPDSFCPDLSQKIFDATQETDAHVHKGGNFITIEGPRFSTRSESNVFRSWGMSIIGMTTSPEAFLAREAEMCYAVMAHVTDYDVWHISEAPVSVEMVVEILNKNTQTAQEAVRRLLRSLNPERSCDCGHALKNALITQVDKIPNETRQRLALLVDRYLE